jgi:hypothetical protein
MHYLEALMPASPHNPAFFQRGPDDQLPDISQLVTTRLRPLQPRVQTGAQHVAHLRAEFRRLSELGDAVEQAITALIIRQYIVSDSVMREALEHSRADLQRFKDELESVQAEHQRAIDRLEQTK